MRQLITLVILAWGAVILLIALVELARGRPLPDVAAVAVMGLLGIGLAIGVWYFMGRQQKSAEKTVAQPVAAAVKPPPKVLVPPSGPIELRQSTSSMLVPAGYAICFLFAAGFLVRYPDTLWTRWISWPAAVVCVLIAAGAVLLAFDRRSVVYVADAQGIEVRSLLSSERVVWKDVAAIKLVETRRRQASSSGRASGFTAFVSLHLVFQDREGEELLSLSDLAPHEAYQRFLEALPVWVGKPVQNETVIN
jgi:hypothetical protein